MECRVEYDYVAQEEDELSLKKGDIITNVTQKMDGWWEGTLRGKTGMFPDNFVKVEKSSTSTAPPEPAPVANKDSGNNGVILRNNKSTRRLKALFSYSPEQEDELKLDIGDVIEFVAEVEEGWWRGKLKGREGIFPSNFVSDYEPTTNGKTEPEQKQNDMNKLNSSKGVSLPALQIPPDVPPAVPASAPPEDEPAPELPPKPVRELARCFYPYQGQNEDELTLTEGDIVTIISKSCEDDGWWRGELKGKTGLFPDNFVKIIPPNESSSQNKSNFVISTTSSNANKISPQAGGRNLKSHASTPDSNTTEKVNGSSVTDGVGSSKMQEKEKETKERPLSKVENIAKAMFSKPFSSGPKPATPTSPVTTGIFGGFGKSELKKEPSFGKEDRKTDEEDFNSVERGEKLNHLTAKRAKAPKRRPPSTLIPRENEASMTNGSFHSQESMDSPPVNHSTPFNSTINSSASAYGTPSGSILDTSLVSGGGSFLSQSKDDSSATSPANGNTSASSAKPKKALPWMEELKKKQDKKQGVTSPVTSTIPTSSNNTPVSPTVSSPTLPAGVSYTTHPAFGQKEKEPAAQPPAPTRAPPLPAKPSTLSTAASLDKTTSVSPSTATPPAPSITNRVFGKKPPVSPLQSNTFPSEHAGGDSRQFVPFEEYAKLRDRVMVLEAELETVRRQVKILLDRELNHGHIV